LKPGQTRERYVTDVGVSCRTTWGHLVAVFLARNGEFWIIRFDGFFRSFDRIHWEKEQHWFNDTSI
jgi:hypothetical protein